MELDSEIKDALKERIEEFDKTYSRFRDDSLVGKLAEKAGSYDFPPDANRLFELYDKLFDLSNGAVTPLVGETLAALGYDADYSFKRSDTLPAIPSWESTVARKLNTLTTNSPVLLDVGAAGKGYLMDLLAEILESNGIGNYIIDASGDILHRADSPEIVALTDPRDDRKAIGQATLSNRSLCASSPAMRRWDDVHHIIDGRSGNPARRVAATWVMADDGLTADGLATALFFTQPQKLKSFDFEYAIMYAGGGVSYNRDGPWEFFVS